RYVGSRGAVSLISTESFPDRQSAMVAATTAYPEVSVEQVPAPAAAGAVPERRGRLDGMAGAVGLLVLLVVGRRRRRQARRERGRSR
ncbi:hypothetical protein, partial [Micromonospora deserti]